MKLVVIGVNHKTAPVALRERLAFAGDDLTAALRQLRGMTHGAVIVSTCNRTEIYALAANADAMSDTAIIKADIHIEADTNSVSVDGINPSKAGQSQTALSKTAQSIKKQAPKDKVSDAKLMTQCINDISHWLADYKNVPLADIAPYLYEYRDTHALTHWLRVAAGLDSMILGEPQILGQIKQSVMLAQEEGCITNRFGWVINQVFACAKQVRHDTEVGSQAVSLGFAAGKLVTQIFDNPSELTLLVVAAGEMNRLVATHIAGLGVGRIIICNRSAERAEALAADLQQAGRQIEVQPLSELANLLPQADVVSSCSGSMDMLINKSMTKQALKKRRYRPMLLVDLAVPRDIDPQIATMDDVYLYSIDDLQHVIAGNIEQRRQAAVDAELLVSQLVVEVERRFQVRKVGGDIQNYRDAASDHAEALLAESLLKLQQGNEPPEAIMSELTRKLTQTLTHAPSKLLRKAAREGDSDLLSFVVTGLNEAYRRRP